MALAGRRITLILGSPAAQAGYRSSLDAHGCLVKIVETGFRGLMDIADDPPEAIVLDVQLPDMDGMTVARNIRQLPRLGLIPLVLLTDAATPAVVQQLKDQGYRHVLNRLTTRPAELVEELEKLFPGELSEDERAGRQVPGRPADR